MRSSDLVGLRGLAALLVCSVLLGAGASEDRPDPPPPEIGISVRQLADAEMVEIVLPGRLIGTPVGATGEDHVLLILLAPEDDSGGPRSLYRTGVDGDGAWSLEELASGLPAEVDAVTEIDLDGDGTPEMILGEPGILYALDRTGDGARPRKVLEAADLDLSMLLRHRLIPPDRRFLPLPRIGHLDLFHLDAGGATAAAGIDLPMRARRVPGGLRLWTPPIRLVTGSDGPTQLFAVGPEAQGKRRLLTTLIDLGAEGAEARRVEIWSQLAANERIAQSWYLSIDGNPALAVAALDADKLGIFEKKKLRVFPLRAERTRAGSPAALQIDTATRNWYPVGVHVADLDLDGRDDLLVVQPEGLGAGKLVVEAFRGKGNGGFFRTPRRTVVTAPGARWSFGHDFDGDGVGDLVTVDEDGQLLVFRGLATNKKLALEKRPRWSFERLGDGSELAMTVQISDQREGGTDAQVEHDLSEPLVADFDRDGHPEILLQAEIGGRSILRLVEPR